MWIIVTRIIESKTIYNIPKTSPSKVDFHSQLICTSFWQMTTVFCPKYDVGQLGGQSLAAINPINFRRNL